MADLSVVLELRRRIFSSADPSAQEDLIDQLVQLEAELSTEVEAPRTLMKVGSDLKNTLSSFPQLKIEASVVTSHFPTGLAHLMDQNTSPLVRVRLTNQSTDTPAMTCRLSACIEGYSATAVKTVVVRRVAGEITECLLPTLFPQAIAQVKEITAATVSVTAGILGGPPLSESTGRIWLLPPSSVILEVRDPDTGKRTDYKRYLPAWVTPNDPAVLEFLPLVSASHPAHQLAGDEGVQATAVREQVAAVYQALLNKGLSYVNTTAAFFPSEGLTGQRVRLPRESLNVPAANCIDGVLLFASILEAISLHPALVFLPGHAVLAWETERNSNRWEYLETTMLSKAPFDAANNAGNKVAAKYKNAKLLSQISVRQARRSGLFPLT